MSDYALTETITQKINALGTRKLLYLLLSLWPASKVLRRLWRQYVNRPSAPCPPGLPYLGHTVGAMVNYETLLDYWESLTKKYGPTFQVLMLGQPWYVITSNPANVEHILKNNFDNYIKGEMVNRRMVDFLGYGIFATDGELWAHQRKTASPMFSESSFKNMMLATLISNGKKLDNILSDRAATGECFDIQEIFYRYSLDSIGIAGFGHDFGCLTAKAAVPFAVAFDQTQRTLNDRFFAPMWELARYIRPQEYEFKRNLRLIEKEVVRMVEQRRADETGQESACDLLSMFARLREDDATYTYDEKFLRDIVLNFLLAGRDTTGSALTWSVKCLHENPEVRKKLLAEVDAISISVDDLDLNLIRRQLPYMSAFIHEVLRLHPSVPKDFKSVVADDYWPDGTFVPKGSAVIWVPWIMGRSTEIWGPDAKVFLPERWLEEQDGTYVMKPKPSPYENPVFNAGRRTCLGMDMALLEMHIVLFVILKRYRIEVDPQQRVHYLGSLTMPVKDGLKVVVKGRDCD
eukprot:NODE_835_length_1872_cov_31.529347_g757_i0.p1 GENE.NODE_835_length_1872_cov_31.529347_g757_i0~~NODE_835_length_1872_cov_31.529347_g757_i0.p1  ORF type:complete len:518 (+),score=90.87 NODE_835_length_1872_cov_31.529347_g757_i0:76-1629(+)